jgi:O-antigen/teichoic acid export membrane protein
MVQSVLKKNSKFIKQNIFSYFVIIFNILSSLYAVRENIIVLNKELYGVWILAFSSISLILIFHFGFINVATFRYSVFRQKNQMSDFFTYNLYVIVVQVLISLLAVYLLILFSGNILNKSIYQDVFQDIMLLAIPGLLFTIISTYLEAVMYFNFKFIYHRNFLELLRLGIMNLLFVYGLNFWKDVRVFSLIYTFVAFLALSITFLLFQTKEKIVFNFTRKHLYYIKDNLNDSFSYWLLSLSSIFVSFIDVFFISTFKSDLGLVTMYSQSFRLQDIALKFIKKITEIKGPKILEKVQEGNTKVVIDIYQKLLLISLILAVLASFLISLFGKYILEYWLDDKIVFDGRLITILSFICITSSIHLVFWNFCSLTGQQQKIKWVIVLEIFLNFSLSYIFMLNFGIWGLGVASMISNSVTILYMYRLFYRYKQQIQCSLTII